MSKEYVAIVRGNPAWDRTTVDLELAPDPVRPGRMTTVHVGGLPAITHIEVIERWRRYALIKAIPETGRTHQIRVHLAAMDVPIVGDPHYGNGHGLYLSRLKPGYKQKTNRVERPLMGRLALHAGSLTFPHPSTGTATTARAPEPADFSVSIKYLRRFAGAPS